MKIMLLAICLLVMGCFKKSLNISGTYISEWSNEFSEVRDTIQINVIQPNEYKITRRTCIMKKQQPEYKLAHWTGDYNSDAQTLVIQNNGRIIYFRENELKMGATIYIKL